MRQLKYLVKNIPIVGYIIRLIAAFILLPRTLARLHDESTKSHKELDELQRSSFAANLKLVELNEEIATLRNLAENRSRETKR